jgi:hypothetical protein
VPRTATAVIALSALALTGCGPSTDDIMLMVHGPAEAYDDALALHEEVIDAGVTCPGTEQLSAPDDPETTFLDCANGLMGMVVAGSEEDMDGFLHTLGDRGRIPYLHGANWIVISPDEGSLRQVQRELGGELGANA